MSDEYDDQQPPSRSQLKREAEAMTQLGAQLVKLDKAQLAKITLPENIISAINEYRKIRSNVASKRQLHYLGKLLRQIDSDDIVNQLDALKSQSQQQTRAFHELEQWRDKLLSDDQALTELLDQHPGIDRQHIRQLIRTARKEQSQNKPPAAARSLFKYLRSIILES